MATSRGSRSSGVAATVRGQGGAWSRRWARTRSYSLVSGGKSSCVTSSSASASTRPVRAGEGPQQQREEGGARAVERRHGHLPVRPVQELLDGVPGPRQRRLHLGRRARQRLPGVGQHQPPPLPLGERDRDGALEQPQLLGDRRGSDEQRVGDRGDAAQLAEFAQDPQLTFVHGASVGRLCREAKRSFKKVALAFRVDGGAP